MKGFAVFLGSVASLCAPVLIGITTLKKQLDKNEKGNSK